MSNIDELIEKLNDKAIFVESLHERELEGALYRQASAALSTLQEQKRKLEEALKPFARMAGPIRGEEGRPTYIEAIEGKEGSGELRLGSMVGTERFEVMWADDFIRARALLSEGGE